MAPVAGPRRPPQKWPLASPTMSTPTLQLQTTSINSSGLRSRIETKRIPTLLNPEKMSVPKVTAHKVARNLVNDTPFFVYTSDDEIPEGSDKEVGDKIDDDTADRSTRYPKNRGELGREQDYWRTDHGRRRRTWTSTTTRMS